jgi:hypothetical protein
LFSPPGNGRNANLGRVASGRCSGTLVRGNRAYAVLTAAHCATNGHGQRAVNWTFAPGNSSGAEPYGRYAARRLFVSPHWKGPAASSVTRPGSMDIGCAMTAGDSGGPWLTGFSPQTGAGTVAAVTAYKLSGDLRTLYGTVLGPTARALYLRASA